MTNTEELRRLCHWDNDINIPEIIIVIVFCSRKDRLLRKMNTRSSTSRLKKKIQIKFSKTGTVVYTKGIYRRMSMEFGFKLCKPARKPCLLQAMKKKTSGFPQKTCYLEKCTTPTL